MPKASNTLDDSGEAEPDDERDDERDAERDGEPDDEDQEHPVAIRSRVGLSAEVEAAIRASLDQQLGHATALIERGTVQLDDWEAPDGAVETVCRIRLILIDRPALNAEERAAEPKAAFDAAIVQVARELEAARTQDDLVIRKRHRGRGLAKGKPATNARGSKHGRSAGATYKDPGEAAGSVIGRRVGRGAEAVKRALARPEKQRRDAYLDTSAPAVSESERRAGGGSTARRNAKARPARGKQVAALEDSRTTASRKSTRRSATRSKQGTPQERTERTSLAKPSSRAAVATARKGVPKRK